METHRKLGLPPCTFYLMSGLPCPSCGMTTSFALLAHGDVAASLRANWVGTTLAVFWAGLLVWAVASGLAGRLLLIPRGRGEVVLTATVGAFLVLMLGRWVAVLIGG
jgi:predicted Na+-dependent transporter